MMEQCPLLVMKRAGLVLFWKPCSDAQPCPAGLHGAAVPTISVVHSNLFEDLVSLVSKTAFPGGSGGGKGLGPVHLISLEALVAVLQAFSDSLDDPAPQLQPATALDHFVDVWGPICRGENPPMDSIFDQQGAAPLLAAGRCPAEAGSAGIKSIRDSASSGGYSALGAAPYFAATASAHDLRKAISSHAGSSGSLVLKNRSSNRLDVSFSEHELSGHAAGIAAQTAAFEKGLKQRIMLAVDHFNKDYKKGFQFLQVSVLSSRRSINMYWLLCWSL